MTPEPKLRIFSNLARLSKYDILSIIDSTSTRLVISVIGILILVIAVSVKGISGLLPFSITSIIGYLCLMLVILLTLLNLKNNSSSRYLVEKLVSKFSHKKNGINNILSKVTISKDVVDDYVLDYNKEYIIFAYKYINTTPLSEVEYTRLLNPILREDIEKQIKVIKTYDDLSSLQEIGLTFSETDIDRYDTYLIFQIKHKKNIKKYLIDLEPHLLPHLFQRLNNKEIINILEN